MGWGGVVLATLCACRGGTSGARDAPMGSGDGLPGDDAGADAPLGDPNSITVVFHQPNGDPVADIPVDFVAPDNGRTTAMTDAQGVARAPAVDGTTAMVLWNSGSQLEVTSYADLGPGDVIFVGQARRKRLGTVVVTWPEQPNSLFGFEMSCITDRERNNGYTYTVTVHDCPNVHSASISVQHFDASVKPDSITTLNDIDLASMIGGTVTMPAFVTGPPATITNQLSNIPQADVQELQWNAAFDDVDGIEPFTLISPVTITQPFDASETLTATMMPSGTHTSSTLLVNVGLHRIYHVQSVDHREVNLSVDVSRLVKGIDGGSYDGGSKTFAWNETAIGRAPDFVHLFTSYFQNGQRITLDLYAPYGAGPSLALPPLPTSLIPTVAIDDPIRIQTYATDDASYRQLVGTLDGDTARFYTLHGITYWTSGTNN